MNEHALFVRLEVKPEMERAVEDFLSAGLRTIHRETATPIRMLADPPPAELIDVPAMKNRLA